MKVLFVTHHYLDITGGGSFASRAYINAFASIVNEVYLIYPDRGGNVHAYIDSKIKFKGVRNTTTKIGKLLDIYCGRINRFYDVIFFEINEYKPDIVVFDNSRVSSGYIKKLKSKGIRVITIHHNYEIEYYKGTKPNLLWRFPFLYYMKKAERKAVIYSDLNLTLTQQDIRLLQDHYDIEKKAKFEKIGIFEFKTNIPTKNINSQPHKNTSNLIFAITGSLDAYQTEISLIPFLKKYYPLILNHYPNSTLIITGKNPSPLLLRQCNKYSNIKVIANPDDISEVIYQADVYICPIGLGGGLKLRIMDGLKVGLPVLTHIVSARGYDNFEKAGFLFTYDNESSFVESLRKSVNVKNCQSNIIEKYSSIFSFDAGKNRLAKILIKYGLLYN